MSRDCVTIISLYISGSKAYNEPLLDVPSGWLKQNLILFNVELNFLLQLKFTQSADLNNLFKQKEREIKSAVCSRFISVYMTIIKKKFEWLWMNYRWIGRRRKGRERVVWCRLAAVLPVRGWALGPNPAAALPLRFPSHWLPQGTTRTTRMRRAAVGGLMAMDRG